MAVSNVLRSLRAVDTLILLFAFFLSLFCLFFVGSISSWALIILINFFACCGIVFLAHSAAQSNSSFLRIVYDWYPAPLIFFVFKEIYVIIHSLGRNDYDEMLIMIDRWLFGTDPTVWLNKFAIPVLTEILQIAYASFYFLMIVVAIEPYLRKEYDKFSVIMFTILCGFFLSYVGYLLVPGVGPRFTLHQFSALTSELPGLFLTNTIRDIINAGESIPKGAENALALAQRDVFPSGHAQMTFIVMYFAAKYKLKTRYVLYTFGTLLVIATVYLRYHYVIDVIAGAVFMWLTVWSAPKLLLLRRDGLEKNPPN